MQDTVSAPIIRKKSPAKPTGRRYSSVADLIKGENHAHRVSQMSPKERLELTRKAKRCLGCLSSSERELLREIAREEMAS